MDNNLIDTQQLNSIINISIPTFGEKYIDKKTVTYYQVEITDKKSQKTWTLDKRFNDFQIFHDSLYKLISNFPSIPGKSFFKISSVEALNKRRLELEQFLIKCAARKDIFMNQLFKDFIEIDKQAADLSSNQVTLKFEYKKIVLGVRSFILVPHKGIMLMCCSDMNIVSRADSMISNFSFFKGKIKDDHVPLGAAFVYQCEDDKKDGYIIHKIWAKSFPIQTGVIAWDDIEEVYSVGNDDGKIYCFKAVPNTHYLKMNQIIELNFHKDRVMGLNYDSEKKIIFSVSTDKTFYKTDLANGLATPSLVKVNDSGYTNLLYDKKNNRIFLTTESGEMQVFSTQTYPIEVLRLLTSSNSCIRAFEITLAKNYAFAGTVDGNICIMNLKTPGKEKLISEISRFGANMKIRVIKYNSLGHELIAGDEDGRVTIWKLKTGKPIYVWEAHPKSAITQMEWDQKNLLLWTGSKDKRIKIWRLPEKWLNDDVEDFEKKEIKNYTEKIAIMKINTKEQDSDDSDNDDLNGWDYNLNEKEKIDINMKNI